MNSRLRFLASGMCCLGTAGLFFLAGCAPRFLAKTPENALRYPYISVSPQELNNYKAMLAINPKDPQTVAARFWIAQDAYNRQDWKPAEKGFREIYKRYSRSEWAVAARYMGARCLVKLKRGADALQLLAALLKAPAQPEPAVREAVSALARDIINDELDLNALAKVRTAYPGTAWEQQALFVSGKRILDAGNPDQAGKIFKQFLDLYPASEFAALARDLMEKALRIVPVNRTRIGCLLPLSGPYAPFGQAVQQGLELALQQINLRRPESSRLALSISDTEATTVTAVAGLLQLAESEKVFAVIGPVLSVSAKVILPELTRLQIPVISPSASDPALAGQSPFFFRYMLTNEHQAEAMAEFVVLRQGLRRIGLLHSGDRYDRSLADSFSAKVQQLGGEIIARQEYAPGTTDFKDQMLGLGGVDPGRMKDQDVDERKALDRLLEMAAYQNANLLAPQAQTATPQPGATPVPGKRVAIVRFWDNGQNARQEELGKKITERFSYTLAAKPGLEVLTQRQTFSALRELGLGTMSLGPEECVRLGTALKIQALVLGEIRETETPPNLNVSLSKPPITYQVILRLIDTRTGRELDRFQQAWVKSVPPEVNLKQIEAFYLPVSADDAILIAPQLVFYDLKGGLFGPDAWLNSKILRQGADILEGAVLAVGYWPDNPEPQNQIFVQNFEKKFAAQPSLLAAQAYDALLLLARAMDRLGPNATRDDLRRTLMLEQEFSGVTGKAWTEPNCEIRREPIFLKLEHGEFQRMQ